MTLDLAIRGGTVATAADIARCDVGIKDGRIVQLAETIEGTRSEIDAIGRLVLPGGIDSHVHRFCRKDFCKQLSVNDPPATFGGIPTRRADLLGGIVTISADTTAIRDGDWTETLYRNEPPVETPATLTAVPYYLWANRGQGSMVVWVPEA